MKKETKSGIVVFIIILLCAGACLWYTKFHQKETTAKYSATNPTGNPSGYSTDTIDVKKSGSEYIAALYVEGTIEAANSTYNQAWLLSTITGSSRSMPTLYFSVPRKIGPARSHCLVINTYCRRGR